MMRKLILNKNNLFFRLVILILIGVSGCSKSNELDEGQRCQVEAINGQDDNIIGEWKLIKGRTVFYEPKTIDYSCDNIIYKFQEDGTLEVSGIAEPLIGLDSGEYSFQLHHEPLEASNEEFTLQINGLTMGSEISAGAMILNRSYLDGPVLHFVRIR